MQISSRKRRVRGTSRSATARNGRRAQLRARSIATRRSAPVRAASNNGSESGNGAEVRRLNARHRAAVNNFAVATRHFYRRNYAKARTLFAKVLDSATPEIAERARVHITLCEQRLSKPAPAPKSATDYYNLGIAELNARRLDLATQYLSKADKAAPNRDDIRYALAAAHALLGKADIAFEHLKAAVELRPENRFHVRHDEDLESLRSDPRYRSLVYPAREAKLHSSL